MQTDPSDAGTQTTVNCREQAIAQACAFRSPFCTVMSAMAIFHQLPTISPATATKIKMAACAEQSRLRSEVENVLGNLAQVTTLLLELFRSGDSEKYLHLDKELELTVGEKERAVGALRQHIKEHKCQPSKIRS